MLHQHSKNYILNFPFRFFHNKKKAKVNENHDDTIKSFKMRQKESLIDAFIGKKIDSFS